MSGRRVLAWVPKGATLTVREVRGDWVLVDSARDGATTRGWVQTDFLLSAPGGEAPPVPGPVETVKMPDPAAFDASKINTVRQKIQESTQVPQNVPNGFSKSSVDPAIILKSLAPLTVKQGYVLRAYQFAEDGNGNGFVFAMPASSAFPDPVEAPGDGTHLPRPRKPAGAVDDPMSVIEGDGSAWSYLAASVLKRELKEFGAMWHGCDWAMHSVLGADPWRSPAGGDDPLAGPSGDETKWKWFKARPADWRPTVTVKGDKVVVTFYTFSPIGKETIYQHIDEYAPGRCVSTTTRTAIAEGPFGAAF